MNCSSGQGFSGIASSPRQSNKERNLLVAGIQVECAADHCDGIDSESDALESG